MQINSQRHSYQPQTSFKGLRSKDARSLFAFDLDGTFLHGSNEDMQKVLQLQQKANAILCYVTGQTLPEFLSKREKYAQKGINIPLPQYLMANNSQFIYKNNDGILTEDLSYRKRLTEKTHFQRETVYDAMKKLAHLPKYKMSESQIDSLEKSSDYAKRQHLDGAFLTSKFSYYEYQPSEFGLEYIVSPDIKVKDFQKDIRKTLQENGIKNKFTYYIFDKTTIDKCNDSIVTKSRPFRENGRQEVKALFLSPFYKSDGVEYISKQLGIPRNEVLTAGNERNDHSLAKLTKKDSFFICVANATEDFLRLVERIKKSGRNQDNLILSTKEGTAGIAEGIEQILTRFGQK